jgi:hypothetical protein
MRISQNTAGWKLVAFSAGMLVLLIIGRWQQPYFSGVLPEATLRDLALAGTPLLTFENIPDHIETKIIRADQSPVKYYGLAPDTPVFIYRATGLLSFYDLDGFKQQNAGTLEIVLNAMTGDFIKGGTVSPEKPPEHLYGLLNVPPTLVRFPEITTEALP